MDAFLRDTWLRRLLPVATGLLGGLVAWALLGLYGIVFGFAGGFLMGAFALSFRYVGRALGHGPREAAMHEDAMRQLHAMGALGPMRLAAPPARQSSAELAQAVAAMETLATTDLDAAIDAGKGLRAAFPRSPAVLARLAIFEQAAGRVADARDSAVEAMSAAFATGATRIALDLHDDFAEDLDQLDASGPTFAALANALARRGRVEAARRCARRALLVGRDDPYTERALEGLEALQVLEEEDVGVASP